MRSRRLVSGGCGNGGGRRGGEAMRRRITVVIVVAGIVAAVVAGGGLAAWASWSVGTSSGVATTDGDTLPRMAAPAVALTGAGSPEVTWRAARFSSGAPVGGYALFRHARGVRTEVCRVPTATLTCTDSAAEPGWTVAYSVRAVAGQRWTGPAGRVSDRVVVPSASMVPPAPREERRERDPEPEPSATPDSSTAPPAAASSAAPASSPSPASSSAEPSIGGDDQRSGLG